MRSWRRDLYRYARNTSLNSAVRAFAGYPGFRFMVMKRICESYSLMNPIGLVGRLWYKRLQVKFGFQIPHTAKIGGGLFMGHFGNIVINQGATIGANCNIAQGVTLGYISRGNKKGCPEVGDRVWIGANAIVVGNIKVGNDVLIAPLSFVNFDVPDHATVMGNPAQVINNNGSAGYVNNILE